MTKKEENYLANINELEASIRKVFGVKFFNEIVGKELKNFKEACKTYRNCEACTNKCQCQFTVGEYGDCPQSKALVMKLRDEMLKQGFAKLDREIFKQTTRCKKEEYRKALLTQHYKDFFQINDAIIDLIEKGDDYFWDGWQGYEGWKCYTKEDYEEQENWIGIRNSKNGKWKEHIYYNQLDHYFTYLIHMTINNQHWNGKEIPGLRWIRDWIKNIQSFYSEKRILIIEFGERNPQCK